MTWLSGRHERTGIRRPALTDGFPCEPLRKMHGDCKRLVAYAAERLGRWVGVVFGAVEGL
jgi:hypothetical protein